MDALIDNGHKLEAKRDPGTNRCSAIQGTVKLMGTLLTLRAKVDVYSLETFRSPAVIIFLDLGLRRYRVLTPG